MPPDSPSLILCANTRIRMNSGTSAGKPDQSNFASAGPVEVWTQHLKSMVLSVTKYPNLKYPRGSTGQSKELEIAKNGFWILDKMGHVSIFFRRNEIRQNGIRRNGLTP